MQIGFVKWKLSEGISFVAFQLLSLSLCHLFNKPNCFDLKCCSRSKIKSSSQSCGQSYAQRLSKTHLKTNALAPAFLQKGGSSRRGRSWKIFKFCNLTEKKFNFFKMKPRKGKKRKRNHQCLGAEVEHANYQQTLRHVISGILLAITNSHQVQN